MQQVVAPTSSKVVSPLGIRQPGAAVGSLVNARMSTELRALMRQIEDRIHTLDHAASRSVQATPHFISTGWPAVDGVLAPANAFADESPEMVSPALGGLACGAIHEWLGLADADVVPAGTPKSGSSVVGERWVPPMSILIHLATQMFTSAAPSGGGSFFGLPTIWWIGKTVWPYLPALARSFQTASESAHENGAEPFSLTWPVLLERCIFIDPPSNQLRWWAIDVALRCQSEAGLMVIADAHGLSMANSRRLQLAAEAGSALGLLARPATERGSISAARTRWLVQRHAPSTSAVAGAGTGATATLSSSSHHPRWLLELFRYKHASAAFHTQPQRWLLEMNRHDFTAAHPVVISANLRHRSKPEEIAAAAAARSA